MCFDDSSIPGKIRAEGGELADRYMPRITSVEMLDLYYARQPRSMDSPTLPVLIEAKEGEAPSQYVEKIAQRFDDYIPLLSEAIRGDMEQFSQNSIHWSPSGLARVDDAKLKQRLADHCVLATMASQDGTSIGTSELNVDQRLYFHPKHSNLSRAVLMLHEALYAAARMHGHKDSSGVRRVISYLIVNSPLSTAEELVKVLNDLTPENGPVFETKTHQLISRLTAELIGELLSIQATYLQQHPKDETIPGKFNELLIKKGLPCSVPTLAGCIHSVDLLSKDQESSLYAENKELFIDLFHARERQKLELKQLLQTRWDETLSAETLSRFNWLSTNERTRWNQIIREKLIPGLAFDLLSVKCERDRDEKETNSCVPRLESSEDLGELSTRWHLIISPQKLRIPQIN